MVAFGLIFEAWGLFVFLFLAYHQKLALCLGQVSTLDPSQYFLWPIPFSIIPQNRWVEAILLLVCHSQWLYLHLDISWHLYWRSLDQSFTVVLLTRWVDQVHLHLSAGLQLRTMRYQPLPEELHLLAWAVERVVLHVYALPYGHLGRRDLLWLVHTALFMLVSLLLDRLCPVYDWIQILVDHLNVLGLDYVGGLPLCLVTVLLPQISGVLRQFLRLQYLVQGCCLVVNLVLHYSICWKFSWIPHD